MPTYCFDSDDGERIFRDGDDAEMPDRRGAMEQVLDLFHGIAAEGWSVLNRVVRGGGKAVVYRVTMVVEGRSASTSPPS